MNANYRYHYQYRAQCEWPLMQHVLQQVTAAKAAVTSDLRSILSVVLVQYSSRHTFGFITTALLALTYENYT